jgi:hypothetical protein
VTTYKKETDLPVIGFDMGGTSTDVSRFAGDYEHVFESTTAGVTIQAPQVMYYEKHNRSLRSQCKGWILWPTPYTYIMYYEHTKLYRH